MKNEREEDQNSSCDEEDPSNSDRDWDDDADFSCDTSVADGAEGSSVLIADNAETKSANVAALVRSGAWAGGDGLWVELFRNMQVLARLLAHLRQKTDDRIVLVSNYTQTLDLFAQLCRERRYPFLRLDGSTSVTKRQKLVNSFNDPSKDEFAFLLSSKAGGCGLNLIGQNRLILFDPDWNPANDKRAAARIWRDGQKKRVYIYRFLSTGTIEEKVPVYQRQMSKEGLQKVIQPEQADCNKGNFFSVEDLTDLFTFQENVST